MPAPQVDFLHEAAILSSLFHPSVLAYFGVSVVADPSRPTGRRSLALVVELCPSGTLKTLVHSVDTNGHVTGPGDAALPAPRLLSIAVEIVDGLAYLHANRIVHRDLKPENIMFGSDGGVKIVDFGHSRTVSTRTMTANIRGSLLWRAPEMVTGDARARSASYSTAVDIYSFGIVLWEMASRTEPYAHIRSVWCAPPRQTPPVHTP